MTARYIFLKKSALCFAAMTVALLTAIPVSAQTDDEQKKDSLRREIAVQNGEEKIKTYLRLSSYYFPAVSDDRVMSDFLALSAEIEAEAERQNRNNYIGLIRINILSAFGNRSMFDEIIKRAPGDMDFLAQRNEWNYYFQISRHMCRAYLKIGENSKALIETKRIYETASNMKNSEGISISLYMMAEIYFAQRRFDLQEECLRQCINLLRNNKSFYHITTNACYSLCRSFLERQMYDEVFPCLAELETLICEYEAEAKTPVMNARYNLWGISIRAYIGIGDYAQAEAYCQKLDSVKIQTINLFWLYEGRARIFLFQEQYAEALKMTEKAQEVALVIPLLAPSIKDIMDIKAEIMLKTGRTDEAIVLFRQSAAIQDSLKNVEINARLDEIRTQYEVDRHIAEKQRNRDHFLFALGGCILLAITLGIWMYYSRQILRKNRELVRKAQQWANVAPAPTVADTEEELPKTAEPTEIDRLLFAEIELLIERGLYKESSLSLDMLAEKTSQNPTYISKAISRCTGKTFKTWLNEYRVKEAVRILSDENNPNISIESVAYDSGFNDRKTFHRIFKQTTGLSPADFKKNGLSK